MPARAARLQGLGTTIFTEMTALAQRTGAINLGQGFPDEDGPSEAIGAAVQALRGGENQYAPLGGVPALRDAVREHQRRYYGLEPEDVLVTFGATEGIASALLGFCDPGDEVVVLEPYYDSYSACIAFSGATRSPVMLRPPDFALDADELRGAIGLRARVMLVNTPHNPTGRVLTRAELESIAEACIEHDLVCVTDEVYEHLVYDGEHIPIATLPGMAERTLTISSVGKSFSFTGWKIGWCSGPAELVATARTVKQFLTFAGGTPLQHASAAALRLPPEHLERLRNELRGKRDLLCAGLADAAADTARVGGDVLRLRRRGHRCDRLLLEAVEQLWDRRDPGGRLLRRQGCGAHLGQVRVLQAARADRAGGAAAVGGADRGVSCARGRAVAGARLRRRRAVLAPLAQEPLQVAGDRLARRQRDLFVGIAGGRLLEPLDERLHVGIALHGDVDLALVVGGRGLEFGGVDRHPDEPLELAHQRERRLRVRGRRDVVRDRRPQARGREAGGWQAACSTPTIPVGPSYDVAPGRAGRPAPDREPRPVTDTGRVCGTSASSAPSVTDELGPERLGQLDRRAC